MTLEFNPIAALFFMTFFGLPMLGLWANAPKSEDDKYKIVHESISSESVDLSKMGANQ